MSVTVTIGGSAVKIIQDSLSIEDVIRERSTASFIVLDEAGTETYTQGEPVSVTDGATTLYTGYIEKPVEKFVMGKGSKLHSIQCKDQHYLADKRIIAKAYESKRTDEIVTDMITNYLADEGITAGTIITGPTLESCVFNYITLTRALEALAEKSEFIWYIDYDKKLYFMPASTVAAPWSIGSSDILAGSISVDRGNAKYRNKQYIKGGKDITDPMTESFKGDGENQTFVVGFPVAKVPTVKVDTVTKTVGIRGIDSGKDWYWSKGEKEVTQDSAGTALTASNVLAITYQGEYDIVAVSSDFGEISAMEALEDSSGMVESVEDENYITNRDDAIQSANAKLTRYARESFKVKFKTLKPGLKAGQMAPVNIPQYTIDTDMLVESVTISTGDAQVYYDVTLAYGVENESWVNLFARMATRGETYVVKENITENEVLITLHAFNKTWIEATANNIFRTINPSSSTQPGSTTQPCFETTQRVRYAELLDSVNAVILRKSITKQTGTTPLVSTTYFNSSEGNGAVAKVRWYGGDGATTANGTGVLVDEQALSVTKTTLEALQIEKTDTKGW